MAEAVATIETEEALVPALGIQRVGIVGCGLMGSGIAEVCARAGLDVVVVEVGDAALAAGRRRIEASLAKAVDLGATIVAEPFDVPGGPTLAGVLDPEGNPLTLVQQ